MYISFQVLLKIQYQTFLAILQKDQPRPQGIFSLFDMWRRAHIEKRKNALGTRLQKDHKKFIYSIYNSHVINA